MTASKDAMHKWHHKAIRGRIFVTFTNVLQNCDEDHIKSQFKQ